MDIWRWILLGLTAVFFSLVGCQPRVGTRTLVIAVPTAPLGFTPNTINEDLTLSLMSNVYECLVDLDSNLQLRPGLAESWYTADDTTWVFRLRQGVRRHDNQLLHAKDVVRALTHALDDPASRRRVQLASVDKVSAPDDSTILIRTRQPFHALPLRLSNVFIWSVGAAGEPVGTGPYVLASTGPRDTVLQAFEGYRDGPPSIHRVVFRAVPEIEERVRLVESGVAQLMIDVPTGDIERLRGRVRVQTVGGLRVFLLGLLCREDPHNPFSNPSVRRALSLAINRSAIVAHTGGHAQVVEAIASPEELGGHREIVKPHAYDPKKARELLAEAGYPRGFDTPLHVSQKYLYTEAATDEVVRELRAVDIRATLEVHAPAEYVRLLESQSMTLFLLGWVSDTGDARVSYDYLLHSRVGLFGIDNGSAYANPDVDRLIEEASQHGPNTHLERDFAILEERIARDVPLIPLFRHEDIYALANDLDFAPRLDRRLRVQTARWQ